MGETTAPGQLLHESMKLRRRITARRVARIVVVLLLVYCGLAYFLFPGLWLVYAHRHPAFDSVPRVTWTGDNHPGDPLNVALIGTENQLKQIMVKARWYPADPLTLRSCLEIAEATVLKRPYDAAPVSSLYLFGRKEDLAFEKPVGNDPRKRHHVRFWRTPLADSGRPIWIGAAMFDEHVGLSRTTGQITHVTGANVDAERDNLIQDLQRTGGLAEVYDIPGFHTICQGKNGGGDPWYTDDDQSPPRRVAYCSELAPPQGRPCFCFFVQDT